jgi:hypothetical protein
MSFLQIARLGMIIFWLSIAIALNAFGSTETITEFTARYNPTMVLCMRLLSVVLVLHNLRSLILATRKHQTKKSPKPQATSGQEEYNPELDFTKRDTKA